MQIFDRATWAQPARRRTLVSDDVMYPFEAPATPSED
jgi:hypothetical protein